MIHSVLLLSLLSANVTASSGEEAEPSSLLLLQDEEAAPGPAWNGAILFGMTETQGNTENFSAALDAEAIRESETDRYTYKAFWVYREDSGDLTERKAGGGLKYDYLAGERHYYYGNVAAETDDQASLDLRYTLGAGVGYDFLQREKVNFAGEAGLAYLVEEFADNTDSDAIALRLAYHYDNQFGPKTNFSQDAVALPAVDDFDDVIVRLDTKLTTNLTDSMLGAVSYVFDWDNTPAAGAKRDDHRFVISLGWSFGR